MAGSIKWFKYTTDSGQTFGVAMDESNGEAVGNPDFTTTDTGVITFALPRNVQPRAAIYRSFDGSRSARVIICDNTANVSNIPEQITLFGDVTANLTQFTGEVYRPIPTAVDTGLNDGDAT